MLLSGVAKAADLKREHFALHKARREISPKLANAS
jgi:hypothetical protein